MHIFNKAFRVLMTCLVCMECILCSCFNLLGSVYRLTLMHSLFMYESVRAAHFQS